MKLKLRSDDRILFLVIPPQSLLAEIARVLVKGVLVGLGDPVQIDEARRTMAEFDNAMFIASESDRIPWRDAYFTKIVVAAELPDPLQRECERVLAPGGEILSSETG